MSTTTHAPAAAGAGPGGAPAVEPAIRTRGLTKSYGRHRGLVDLDLEVRRGEVFGFIGPNGAGKTTTIRLLLDLLRPSSGSVEVLGREPRAGGPALRRRLGYLPGDLVLPARLTGRAIVDLLLALSGPADAAGRAARRERIEVLAERLDLDLQRPTRALSKGNRQKVGLVQALAHDPDLLVLDEPTSGLDPLVQQAFHALVREAAARGVTVFMSSHVISEVEQTADRVGVLREGRLVALATVDELRSHTGRRVEVELRRSPGGGAAAATSAASSAASSDATSDATSDGSGSPTAAAVAAALSLDAVTSQPGPAPGGIRVAGSHAGEPAALVAALAAAPWSGDITDLVVAPRDLEDAVLGFYDTTGDGTTGDSTAGDSTAGEVDSHHTSGATSSTEVTA